MNTKYFVFAWDEHEELGGMNDLAKVCDTFEEAEKSIPSLDTQNAPYGYWEDVQIIAFHDNFTWEEVGHYLNKRGIWMRIVDEQLVAI